MRGVAPSARLGGRPVGCWPCGAQSDGINLWRCASAEIEAQRAMVALVKSSHPQIGTIVDAPVQMRRAPTPCARPPGGGDADFEAALRPPAWPDGQAP
jgi:hypothetical protein